MHTDSHTEQHRQNESSKNGLILFSSLADQEKDE